MITYQREQQQTIPDSEVIIVGVGGAGGNMLDRVALDGMEEAQQLALNTDSRTLASTVAAQKVQMGMKLTRGLGCGGDPELGLQAAMEVETEIRDALRGHKMVFVCVGLGGGTGSGAAPLVTRIAREMGAFVVVFGTMPFSFEGRRRREQAETALNELSVLANALVTFDNGRMGELVLASQGIHEAFAAADNMISESIRAVTRLVVKPGLINVGLDDLMSSLRATRSRCLFGSGIASGENRSQKALKNALNSPLLDKGRLLKNTQTALVHVCGGTEMTLYEVELLMRELSKTVPESAHILFGAAVDDSMGDSLSITIISSLPEELVVVVEDIDSSAGQVAAVVAAPVPNEEDVEEEEMKEEIEEAPVEVEQETEGNPEVAAEEERGEEPADEPQAEEEAHIEPEPEPEVVAAEPDVQQNESEPEVEPDVEVEEALEPQEEVDAEPDPEVDAEPEVETKTEVEPEPEPEPVAKPEPVKPKKKSRFSRKKKSDPQGELLFDSGARGKFEGEAPNMVDGEDLDIPPFLRNRK